MVARHTDVLTGTLIDEKSVVTISEICDSCGIRTEAVVEMVAHGILEPSGDDLESWRFRGDSLRRVRTVVRLRRDLDLNLAGAALALDLLEQVESLRRRLRALAEPEER